MSGTIHVCKMCGRAGRYNEQPDFCYFDRMSSIENISDEDAEKMGLNIPKGQTFEFPGDVKWDPFTGKPMEAPTEYEIGQFYTLREWQESVMGEVRQG